MDVQLKELIDRIKNDGVKNAEDEAARILADAETKAAAVMKKAEEDAEALRASAKADAEKAERSGKEALRQAGRDLLLSLRAEIERLFTNVLMEKTGETLDAALMAEAVQAAVGALAELDSQDATLLLPEDKASALESQIRGALSAQFSKGMDVKPIKGLDAGFRISTKDGSVFYDFSDREIAMLLARFLNPQLAKLLAE